MKFIIAAGAAAAALGAVASAGEWADACIARLEADGRDTSGCQCLEDAITAYPARVEEFRALAEIADPAARYEAASADAKAAMDDCTR